MDGNVCVHPVYPGECSVMCEWEVWGRPAGDSLADDRIQSVA